MQMILIKYSKTLLKFYEQKPSLQDYLLEITKYLTIGICRINYDIRMGWNILSPLQWYLQRLLMIREKAE